MVIQGQFWENASKCSILISLPLLLQELINSSLYVITKRCCYSRTFPHWQNEICIWNSNYKPQWRHWLACSLSAPRRLWLNTLIAVIAWTHRMTSFSLEHTRHNQGIYQSLCEIESCRIAVAFLLILKGFLKKAMKTWKTLHFSISQAKDRCEDWRDWPTVEL